MTRRGRTHLPAAVSGVLVVGCLGSAALGFGALPAYAGAPDIQHFTIQSDYTLDANSDLGCNASPDFSIAVSGVDNVVAQTFYDKAGNVTRTVVHDDFTGTETGSNNNALNSSEHAKIIDYPDGSESWTGQPLRVSLPDGGNVILDAGKLVYNSDGSIAVEHGPHPFLDGDVAAYCAALGAS
ncbi:MAG: hypothetical protein ACRDP1_13550 [Nocardioidaceae bacterium]